MCSRQIIKVTLALFSACMIAMTMKSSAQAHVPFMANDEHPTVQSALTIENITTSKVIYQIITNSTFESWIQFEGRAGDILYLQLGIPYIDELENYRPSVAILPPSRFPKLVDPDGIQDESLNVLNSTGIIHPEIFHERFTNTKSWILVEQRVSLDETGTYFIVSFSPNNEPGKLWLAVGREERFGPSDIAKLPSLTIEVRKFHESDPIGNPLNYLLLTSIAIISAVGAGTIWLVLSYSKKQIEKVP